MLHGPDLQWQKSRDGWIPLDQLSLQSKFLNDAQGIYILWAGNNIVKIGKGRIRDELSSWRLNGRHSEKLLSLSNANLSKGSPL